MESKGGAERAKSYLSVRGDCYLFRRSRGRTETSEGLMRAGNSHFKGNIKACIIKSCMVRQLFGVMNELAALCKGVSVNCRYSLREIARSHGQLRRQWLPWPPHTPSTLLKYNSKTLSVSRRQQQQCELGLWGHHSHHPSLRLFISHAGILHINE